VEVEEIAMDFIVGLSRTQSGYDSIWVIMDRLTKVAHFILVKTTYSGPQLTELYMSRIVCLHGVPKRIVSDRGTQFTLKFWERLHETLDTQLCFSSEASFQELKKRLMTALILVMPNLEKPFSIYCDASGQGLGCVFMQDGHVVAYASR
jgi:hypothetical protein